MACHFSDRVIRIICTVDCVRNYATYFPFTEPLVFINPNLLRPNVLELLRTLTFRSPYASKHKYVTEKLDFFSSNPDIYFSGAVTQ